MGSRIGSLAGVGSLAALLALGCADKPNPAIVHREAGDERLQKGDHAGAAAEYQQSLAANPKQEQVWEKLALSKARLGDRDGAAAALLETLPFKRNPEQKAELYRNAAGIYLQSPERDKAEKYLLEVLKLAPEDEGSLSWLAEMEAERGGARSNEAPATPEHLDAALRYYRQLADLRPTSSAPLAHQRIVLSKYLQYLSSRRAAAQQAMRWKKREDVGEARQRIDEIQRRTGEIQGQLEAVNRKIAELRRPKATTVSDR
jgi:tetratricopeptide (TPR) repeat protein